MFLTRQNHDFETFAIPCWRRAPSHCMRSPACDPVGFIHWLEKATVQTVAQPHTSFQFNNPLPPSRKDQSQPPSRPCTASVQNQAVQGAYPWVCVSGLRMEVSLVSGSLLIGRCLFGRNTKRCYKAVLHRLVWMFSGCHTFKWVRCIAPTVPYDQETRGDSHRRLDLVVVCAAPCILHFHYACSDSKITSVKTLWADLQDNLWCEHFQIVLFGGTFVKWVASFRPEMTFRLRPPQKWPVERFP